MKVKEHIKEMKKRMLKIVLPLSVLFVFLFSISQRMIKWTLSYYDITAYSLNPLESLSAQIMFSGIVTFIIALPLITFQLYQFTRPIKEIKNITNKIFLSEALAITGFLLGIFLFGKFMIITLNSTSIVPVMWGIKSTINLIYGISFALAMILQLIIILPLLNNLGILNVNTLKRYRLFIVIILFLISAVITPTGDMLTQLMIALPLWLSIEIGILLSDKKKYTEMI